MSRLSKARARHSLMWPKKGLRVLSTAWLCGLFSASTHLISSCLNHLRHQTLFLDIEMHKMAADNDWELPDEIVFVDELLSGCLIGVSCLQSPDALNAFKASFTHADSRNNRRRSGGNDGSRSNWFRRRRIMKDRGGMRLVRGEGKPSTWWDERIRPKINGTTKETQLKTRSRYRKQRARQRTARSASESPQPPIRVGNPTSYLATLEACGGDGEAERALHRARFPTKPSTLVRYSHGQLTVNDELMMLYRIIIRDLVLIWAGRFIRQNGYLSLSITSYKVKITQKETSPWSI